MEYLKSWAVVVVILASISTLNLATPWGNFGFDQAKRSSRQFEDRNDDIPYSDRNDISVAPRQSYGAPQASVLSIERENEIRVSVPSLESVDDVLEIAVRRIKTDQATFEQARSDFINLLSQQDGVVSDAEFQAVSTLVGTSLVPEDKVFVGMTQYDNIETFQKIQAELGQSPELQRFFETFDTECFAVYRGFQGDLIDLKSIPFSPTVLVVRTVNPGQLERFNELLRELIQDSGNQENGLIQYKEFVSIEDSHVRAATTAYTNLNAAENEVPIILEHPKGLEYLSTITANCYYILNRLY